MERTTKGKCLPVYTDYAHNQRASSTLIRRVYGSVEALTSDLQQAMPQGKIVARPDLAQVEIKGNYSAQVKKWLENRGF